MIYHSKTTPNIKDPNAWFVPHEPTTYNPFGTSGSRRVSPPSPVLMQEHGASKSYNQPRVLTNTKPNQEPPNRNQSDNFVTLGHGTKRPYHY
jgi:hypothetical protein